MAYLVGATTVIDADGNIDWARISGKPTIGDVTGVTVTNGTPTAVTFTSTANGFVAGSAAYALKRSTSTSGGATATSYNCYVESLSGGGTSGALTVTANRKLINCACQCRC